jgi:LPXTG-motif cell wall-anchored protein
MDTARWKHGDEFAALDLRARFAFKTTSSLSFELGTLVNRDSPRLPETGDESWDLLLAAGSMFAILGWLDAHHPCDGHHNLQLRVGLPDRYVSWESMRDLVPQVIAALGLPADEPYHVHLAGLSRQASTEWPQSGFVSYSGGGNHA